MENILPQDFFDEDGDYSVEEEHFMARKAKENIRVTVAFKQEMYKLSCGCGMHPICNDSCLIEYPCI